MMRRPVYFIFLLIVVLVTACNPSKNLVDGQYWLAKNTVKVVDRKGNEFGNLQYTLRPVPNTKFLDVFPIKATRYVNHQPTVDSLGNVVKDTKYNKRMREAGEELVLLDTTQISYSLEQLQIATKNLGYFNARVWHEIEYKNPNKLHPRRHKADVNYFVEANEPYYIRDIHYDIDIFEYKRIILKDTVNTLLKRDERYSADNLLNERTRIVNNIRDHGYYYVSNDIVSFEIDTLNSAEKRNKKGYRTLSIKVLVNFSRITDKEIRDKHAYKYYFGNVVVYPNYNPLYDYENQGLKTKYHRRKDETNYLFVTVNRDSIPKRAKDKPIPDIRYRILIDNILTKQGELYSQNLISRSRKKLNDLKNFSYIDISILENTAKRDTVQKTGYLNTVYRLTRNKLHSLAGEFDARSDRTSLSLTYSNKNLFRSAEYFNINIYGALGFRLRLNRQEGEKAFQLESREVGGEVSMDFRRLLFFRRTQKIEAVNYGTSLKLGAHYQYNNLYERGLYNFAWIYNLAHNEKLSHTITPIDLSVINISTHGDEFQEVIKWYSKDFQEKYKDNILLSFKYRLTYVYPAKDKRNSLIIRLKLESSGMLISAINTLAKAPRNEDGCFTLWGSRYGNYESAELDLRYTYNINPKNSVATRFNLGIAVPLWNSTTLPFEKSFYLGGANSMRAWDYRTLGPGSYYNTNEKVVNDVRVGDIKLEMNLEYRGTLYKFIKYGVFVDAGNIWLTRKDADMPNADFQLNRFYKEIAISAGVGLRFDFNFFIIRLDAAVPIYDPSSRPGSHWLRFIKVNGDEKLNKSVNIIFGIGHAF